MVSKGRNELIEPTDTVALTATFKDEFGNPIDTDSYPQITINDPNGLVVLGPTSNGVSKISTGKYQYDFTLSVAPALGVWADTWIGFINTNRVEGTLQFVVATTDMPAINLDGYYALGDDPGFHYSQVEIFNINKLLKTLKARLNSTGKVKKKDAFGNDIMATCDIFSVQILVTFLANSLTIFNEIPHFTFFTFADTEVINLFHDVIVEGAVIWALASQALLERGAEYVINDNGVSFTPPALSELLNTQSSNLMTLHQEKVKFIKNTFKPHPISLGTLSIGGGNNPAIKKLRLIRSRKVL